MEPELKRIAEETLALTKENNKMLHAMRRSHWFGLIGRIIIWIILFTLPLYLYQQYFRPLISKFSTTQGTTATSPGPFGLPTFADIQKLINSYKVGK